MADASNSLDRLEDLDHEATSFARSPVDQVQLDLIYDDAGNALLYLSHSPTDDQIERNQGGAGKLLACFHRDADVLETFPLRAYPSEDNFLTPKHGDLLRIVFEGFDFGVPDSAGDAADLFLSLPEGFVKLHEHGLGIYKKNAAIVHAVTAIPGVNTLVIHRSNIELRVEKNLLHLSKHRFDALRRALERVTVNYRSEAAADKRVLVHNELLSKLDARRFPPMPPRYKPNIVYRIVEATASKALSSDDQKAAVQLVSGHKDAIAAAQPKLAMRLKSELELVTLTVMINKFRGMLEQAHTEQGWQTFFARNSFVLSMAFGYPVVHIGDQIAVGGTRFTRGGTKYSDFAARHASTGNLVIVEIKRPSTRLLAKKEYRGGVYPWSTDMTGGIQQVLDQRYQLQRNLPTLKDDSGLHEAQGYAIDCVLIAGDLRQLEDAPMKKSFEIARRSVHGVMVVTFDELLAKLEALQAVLGEGIDVPATDAASLHPTGHPVTPGSSGLSTDFTQDAKELQRQLAMVDLRHRPARPGGGSEFLVLKLGKLKIKMYLETGHQNPHVHVDYGNENHVASYSIDPTSRLAGNLEAKYEKTVLLWIEQRREALLGLWQATQRGQDNTALIAALAGDN